MDTFFAKMKKVDLTENRRRWRPRRRPIELSNGNLRRQRNWHRKVELSLVKTKSHPDGSTPLTMKEPMGSSLNIK